MPFPLLYLLSDLFFVIVYYLIGYRRKVVITNLRNSFPEKSEGELHKIEKAFYRYLLDLTLEGFKMLTISSNEVKKRMACEDFSMIEDLKLRDQNFIYVLGHQGNWEWIGHSLSRHHVTQTDSLYHPLSNKFFDWLMYKMRTRAGTGLFPMQSSIREMIKRKNQLNGTAFIADQTPSSSEGVYWMTFLNQDTPVFTGTEKIAKKFNYPVVFISVKKIKRGYYVMSFKKVTDKPLETTDGFITETHTHMLEDDIKRQPEIWLWSHRRWKHRRKV